MVFLEELEKLGERTPLRGIDQESWKEACRLVQITEDVAPVSERGRYEGAGIGGRAEQAAQRINFGTAGFEVEAFRKRRRNERAHG